jgi:hypothetical protein
LYFIIKKFLGINGVYYRRIFSKTHKHYKKIKTEIIYTVIRELSKEAWMGLIKREE